MMVNSALRKSCHRNLICLEWYEILHSIPKEWKNIIWVLHGAGAPGGLWCLSSFVAGGVVNSTSDLLFTAPLAHEVGLALGFVGSFGVWVFLWLEVSLDGVVVLQSCGGTVFHVAVLASDIHLVLELVDFLTNS